MEPFLYWLVEGKIKASFYDGTTEVFGQGLIGGEYNLLLGVETNCTVAAITNCSVMKLSLADFYAIPGILRHAVEMRKQAAIRLLAAQSWNPIQAGLN